MLAQGSGFFRSVCLHQYLCVIALRTISRIGQVEAGRGLSDEGRQLAHMGIPAQRIGQLIGECPGTVEGSSFGQPYFHGEILFVEQRHELFGHGLKADIREVQQSDQYGDERIAVTDASTQQLSKTVIILSGEQFGILSSLFGAAHKFLNEEHILCDGQNPAQEKRYGDDQKQRGEDLARNVRRQIYRQEGKNRNQRCSEQRHGSR